MDIDKAKQSITAARDVLKAAGPEGLHADAAAAAAGNLDEALGALGDTNAAGPPPATTAPPADNAGNPPNVPVPETAGTGPQPAADNAGLADLSDDALEDEIERRSQQRRDAARHLT